MKPQCPKLGGNREKLQIWLFQNILWRFLFKFNYTDFDETSALEDRQGAVCRIKCCDCQVTNIGETGRNVGTRLTEHKRVTRNGDVNNDVAEHHLQVKHQINLDSATCIIYSTVYSQRLTLESWFTNLEQMLLNRSQQLPAATKGLLDGLKQN